MAKSHLAKSVRKHIAKEKNRLRRDNLTQEEYKKKVDDLYEALERKPKEKKEKREEKPIGKAKKKPPVSKGKNKIKIKTPTEKIDEKQKTVGLVEPKKSKLKVAAKNPRQKNKNNIRRRQ